MSSFNLSELFESVAAAVPERTAVVSPARTLTYAELEERATRLANHLASAGVGAGDHVGLYLLNGTEYLEGMLAAFKLRAVPINVNYRYVERELLHLFDDADLVAVIYDASFAPRVAAIASSLTKLRHFIEVDSGTGGSSDRGTTLSGLEAVAYEEALAAAPAEARFKDRSGDDLYIVYTGGTTGMPKGVMWRHEDLFFAALGGGDALLDKGPITDPGQLPERVPSFPLTQLCAPPLMHVSAHWAAFITFFGGGKVVLTAPGKFDPNDIWATVGKEGVNTLTVVGDAMARPLLDQLAAAEEGAYNLSTLIVFASGGAILSTSTKGRVGELLPNVILIDSFGSSETGVAGSRSGPGAATETGRFNRDPRTHVLDENMKPVEPGSGTVGRLAKSGHVPLGYYKDEAKTKATFVEVDGTRYVLPGDMATIDEDGSIILLGRGSTSINTGGEKVFPEEVESVLKGHPDLHDALVVGLPDDRWGERVVAVVSARSGSQLEPTQVIEFARSELAGYKVPREVVVVDEVRRAPNGKPDYAWAKEAAAAARVGQ